MSKTMIKNANERTISALAQCKSLLWGEAKLMGRNQVQVFYAVVFPFMFPLLYMILFPAEGTNQQIKSYVVAMIVPLSVVTACVMASYYTAVSALVNRREEAVLQRLRTGEASEATILAAIITPGSVLAAAVSVVIVIACVYLLNLTLYLHVWLVILGIVLSILVCIVFAFVTANFTRTAEAAQVTATPFMMIVLLSATAPVIPREGIELLYYVVNLLPTAPASHLIAQGFSEAVDWMLVLRSIALSLAWIAVVGFIGLKRLRWAKR